MRFSFGRCKTFIILAALYEMLVVLGDKAEATLCVYHLKGSDTIVHPGSPTSSLPKKFFPKPSTGLCIAYGTVGWTRDLEIRIINSTTSEVELQAMRRVSLLAQNDKLFPLPPIIRNLTHTVILRGNETADLTILFPEDSNISILYRRSRKQRKFYCPSLQTHFDVISCTNGDEKHSECTYRCKENYGPSPLLYRNDSSKEHRETKKLGKSLPFFSSACRRAKDGSPRWNPDALSWRSFYYSDSQFYQHSTCLSYRNLSITCSSGVGLFDPCKNYPLDLLLEIYDQKSDVVYVKPTHPPTTEPPPPFTSLPDEIGLKTLNAIERLFVLNELKWRDNCLEQLAEIVQDIDGDVDNHDELVIRKKRTYRVIKKISDAFKTCISASEETIENPCEDFCKKQGNKNAYEPEVCGSFSSDKDKSQCLRCRMISDGCTIASSVIGEG